MAWARGWWRRIRPVARIFRDPWFWAVQAAVVTIAALHSALEVSPNLPTDLADVLPVSFFWVPLLFAALRFGLAGAATTCAVVVLASLPNWFYLQRVGTLPQELLLVIIACAVSLLVGRQTDSRLEAQKNAQAYAAYAVREQEEERRRLSLDLHDDPIQTLVSACHELDGMISTQPTSPPQLVGVRTSVATVIQKLRDIGTALRPPVLDDMGLVPALRGLLGEYTKEGTFEGGIAVSGEQRRLPGDIELAAFRITQEALRNAAHHAAASHVRASIDFGVSQATLVVEDDGKGFDTPIDSVAKDGHWGLLGMKERAEMMGGSFNLLSQSGKGTRITVHLPVPPPPG